MQTSRRKRKNSPIPETRNPESHRCSRESCQSQSTTASLPPCVLPGQPLFPNRNQSPTPRPFSESDSAKCSFHPNAEANMSLTTKKIAALKPRESRYSIADGNGLTLRVQPSGSKSWVFRSHHSGRISDETIGHWPEMSLKQARMLVRRRRKEAGLTPPTAMS